MALTVPVDEIVANNSNGLLGKHETWERVRIGEIATVKNGAAFRSARFNDEGRGLPLIRIRDVLCDQTAVHYDGPYEDEYLVEPGDLVVGMDGDFASAFWRGPTALLNQRVCRIDIHSDEVNRRFVRYTLQGYLDAVNEVTSAVTVKHLSSKTVAALPLPLPPRAEQDRIVEAVESAMAAVEAGTSDLDAASRLVRALESVACAAAFADAGSPVVSLDDVATVQSGLAKAPPKGEDLRSYPYIRTANVQAGFLDLEVIKEIRMPAHKAPRYELRGGDVLVLEGGDADKVGRGWIWESQVPGALHQNHVFAVRSDVDRLDPRYLAHFINAPPARTYFLGVAKQTTNLASINKTQLRALPIPLPDIALQRRRIAKLEHQLAATAQLRAELISRIAETDVLRRSILHRAFTGQLVPQDPNDEPASELIARIKAEKAELQVELTKAQKRVRLASEHTVSNRGSNDSASTTSTKAAT